jgi:CheY-like chemotaxis protein
VARLEQVLVNLLTNAAKYTEEGGHVWLTVEEPISSEEQEAGATSVSGGLTETAAGAALQSDGDRTDSTSPCATLVAALPRPCESDSLYVRIRVRDNGVGISPTLLPHIFDLFTQADRSLDRSQGGLGIGLALVQRLTELHGGKVEARSVVGQGSEFIVSLPVMQPTAQEPAADAAETRRLPSRPLRVLVVDDNVDTVLGFSMLLKASGHDVRTAHDGQTALEAALDHRPDLVLLDIGLPGLNGYEVAKRIRQHATLKNVTLVASTGYGQETDRQTSLQAGFNHHLVKPARFEQLQQILATVSEQVN